MENLQCITKSMAINTIRFVEKLGKTMILGVIAKQLLRSGTSVGANYRAAMRAKSMVDFIAKLGIVEEEADECLYWTELLVESGSASTEEVEILQSQADQILAMTVASIKTARLRLH
jgi:four helix bundle protein